jgi:hypothetical protein
LRIQGRESSAALAFWNSRGLIPPGAVGAVSGAGGGGASGTRGAANMPMGSGTELAAEEISNPPAPAAPSLNISLRFKDIRPLQKPRPVVSGTRLIADNSDWPAAASIAPTARFIVFGELSALD